MKSQDIRKTFLDFFRSKGHTIVPSASLVPENDATLLFTNAGMNQFKDVFLGTGKRDYKRAADTQKCMRVSGKHNDLEDVGKDTYHHTLFEMLGNWSFGDYYKKEAIEWAWELLTSVWKLPKDKLYATVHHTDDEALELWGKVTDIDKKHILKFGDKDNFWEMGATGPCGPCSEIHIDRGDAACDKKDVENHVCGVNSGCARYIELWNLVFIQYNRGEEGKLTPLPSRHVDTGMGFERIVSVIQGKKSNYDTDLFTPIVKKTEELCGRKYEETPGGDGTPFRVIADHIRSLVFSMADGVMPSNEGRGYVIRKILRRAIRYGKYLGFDAPFLHQLADTVADVMGDAFPEIVERKAMVKGLIRSEEESFYKTITRGLDKLNEIVGIAKKERRGEISGEAVFMLYDSLGLPLDFIQHTAEDEKLTLDMKGFEELMEQQKERARASWKGAAFNFALIADKAKPTEYLGETQSDAECRIEMLVKGNALIQSVTGNDEVIVITDKTPFYAEKGGQTGDIGVIEKGQARIVITGARTIEDVTLHYGQIISGEFSVGDKALLRVDKARKDAVARNHTATHLIHKALRNTVGSHAAQAGSLVGPERLRFDFTHSKALTKEEIERIENEVNKIVLANLPVTKTKMSKDEAVKSGAVAIFEEKYGDVVRVIEVEGYSKELCGGTHVNRTGDIGLVKIVGESSISAGTRRIEAVTGLNSLDGFREYYYMAKELASILNTDEEKLKERVLQVLETLKQKDREIGDLKKQIATSLSNEWIKNLQPTVINNQVKYYIINKDNLDKNMPRDIADNFITKDEIAVINIYSTQTNTNQVVNAIAVTKQAEMLGLKANQLIAISTKTMGGNGGGKPDFAQGVGKDPSKIEEAYKKVEEIIEKGK